MKKYITILLATLALVGCANTTSNNSGKKRWWLN